MDISNPFAQRPPPGAAGRSRLEQIAEVTGFPIESFFPGAEAQPGLLELIALWDAIGDEAGRRALLSYARSLAPVPVSSRAR